jgi:hypothetical protein
MRTITSKPVNKLIHSLFKYDWDAISGFRDVANLGNDDPLKVERRKAFDKVLDDFVAALEPAQIESIVRTDKELVDPDLDLSAVPEDDMRGCAKKILENEIRLRCHDGA